MCARPISCLPIQIFGHFLAGNGYLSRKLYFFIILKVTKPTYPISGEAPCQKCLHCVQKCVRYCLFLPSNTHFWSFPGRKWLFEQENIFPSKLTPLVGKLHVKNGCTTAISCLPIRHVISSCLQHAVTALKCMKKYKELV